MDKDLPLLGALVGRLKSNLMERLQRSGDAVDEAGIEGVEQPGDLGSLGTVVGLHGEPWDPTLGLIVGHRLWDLQLWGLLVCPLHR